MQTHAHKHAIRVHFPSLQVLWDHPHTPSTNQVGLAHRRTAQRPAQGSVKADLSGDCFANLLVPCQVCKLLQRSGPAFVRAPVFSGLTAKRKREQSCYEWFEQLRILRPERFCILQAGWLGPFVSWSIYKWPVEGSTCLSFVSCPTDKKCRVYL